MKLLSSSTTSSNANYTSSKVRLSCISGMLRRLLCSNSLPTHPSDDHISLSTTYHYCDHTKEAEADGLSLKAPGVVARLMGLEEPFSLDHSKASNTTSILNSVDLLREINSPTYMELEDENFFILSFESREIVSKRQRKNNFAEIKIRESVDLKKKQNLHVINYEEKLDDDKVILMHEEIWSGFSRLADRETMERNWLQKEICKFEYCKEIGGGIGLIILDHLLKELVDQLVEQPL